MSAEQMEKSVLDAAVQAAHDKVTDMCTGSGRWTMSIPARPDHDHDLVITRALNMQADALTAARREVETMREAASREWPMTWVNKPTHEWDDKDIANYVAGYWRHRHADAEAALATSRAALEDACGPRVTPDVETQRRIVAEWIRGGTVADQYLIPSLWECAQRGELTFTPAASDAQEAPHGR